MALEFTGIDAEDAGLFDPGEWGTAPVELPGTAGGFGFGWDDVLGGIGKAATAAGAIYSGALAFKERKAEIELQNYERAQDRALTRAKIEATSAIERARLAREQALATRTFRDSPLLGTAFYGARGISTFDILMFGLTAAGLVFAWRQLKGRK